MTDLMSPHTDDADLVHTAERSAGPEPRGWTPPPDQQIGRAHV